jgi:phosphatidylglycerophosphate synthase
MFWGRPLRTTEQLTRIQQNFLAKSERRLLDWLCARLPVWLTPDMLTATGLAGALAVFAGYCLSTVDERWLWLAIGGLVLNWFGDSLDGSVARFRQIERPSFGYFIDHSCDGLSTLLILAGMGLSPYLRLDVAMFCLAGYLLLSIHAFLSARVLGELKLSHVGAGPTELRLLLIVLNLTMWALGQQTNWFPSVSGFDVVAGGVGLALIILFIIQTIRTGRRLATQQAPFVQDRDRLD